MVEVELDEPDGPDPVGRSGAPGAPHRGSAHPPDPPDRPGTGRDVPGEARGDGRARRRRLRIAAGAVVVVVAAVAGIRWEAASVAADDARVAAHAGLPGFATSLREPLEERWRTSGAMGAGEGLVLVAEGGTDRRVVALDAASGEQRWAVADPAAGQGGLWCPEGIGDRDLLLCWVPGDAVGGPNTDLVLEGMRPDRLVILAGADGAVVGGRDLPPQTVGWAPLGADVVLAYRDGDALRLERSDPLTGEVRWSVSPPVTLPGAVVSELALDVSDGFVVLTGPVNAVVGPDGALLGTWTTPDGATARVDTSSVGFAVWTSREEGTWYDASGAPGARLVGGPFGEPWAPPLDDGDHPGLVLVRKAAGLQVVDVLEAGPLWERASVDRVLLRVDDRLVVVSGDEVLGLDLRTGRERWSVTLEVGADPSAVVSDGARVLLPRYSAEAGRGVTAYDLADGSPLWTAPVPEGTSMLGVLPGGVVVTYGFADLVVLDRPSRVSRGRSRPR